MSQITIEGVVSTTALPRGERVTVERTERVEQLLADGYVRDVDAAESNRDDDVARNVEGEPISTPVVQIDANEPPKRSASRQEWFDYVRALGITGSEDDDRAKLIADYDDYVKALGE